MKVLSRLASPVGFALMLLLFFLLPFISVSCDVPGMGTAGVNYSGTNLVTGSDPSPEVPDRLKELVDSLPGGSDSTGPTEDPPNPGVQVLAIITVVLAVAGIATVLVSRMRARLFGAGGAALATLAMAIVTLLVSQGNLEDLLLADARESGVTEDAPGVPDIEASIPDLVRTEVGFWLVVVVLAVIVLLNAGMLFAGRLRAAAVGGGPPDGLPFGGAAAGGPATVDPLTGQPVAESAPPTTPFAAQPAGADAAAATEPPAAETPTTAPTVEPPAAQPSATEPTTPAPTETPATQPPAEQPSDAQQPPPAEPPDAAPPDAPPADPPTRSS